LPKSENTRIELIRECWTLINPVLNSSSQAPG